MARTGKDQNVLAAIMFVVAAVGFVVVAVISGSWYWWLIALAFLVLAGSISLNARRARSS